MSYKKLKEFVKEQQKQKQDPKKIREGLILNGWKPEEVDKAIRETYGLKNKITKLSLIIAVILIFIFSASLLLLIQDPKTRNEQPLTQNQEQNNNQQETTLEKPKTCADHEDVFKKEECYEQKILEGYNCANLEPEEKFFCNRILETELLNAFTTQT